MRTRATRCCLGLAVTGIVPGAYGAVEFVPELSAGIAYTDNVTLSAAAKESETVYQLLPAFQLTQESSRVNADVAYRMEAYSYKDRGSSDVYHMLASDMGIALDPDNFFMEFAANLDQVVGEPRAAIPRGNLPISTNRLDRANYSVGPLLQYPFAANGTARASYRRGWTRYDDEVPVPFQNFGVDFEEDSLDVSFDNFRKERGFTWAARYNADKTDYGQAALWEYRQATLELGTWIGQGLRLFVSGGQESPWERPFDPSLEDGFWEAGLAKQAGESFRAELAAGERSFGSSKRAAVSYKFLKGAADLRYTEQPTLQDRNPYGRLLLPDDVQDLLTRPGAPERYLSKRVEFTSTLTFHRMGVNLVVYDETREDRVLLDGTALDDESATGGRLTSTWRVGGRTDLTLTLQADRLEFGPGDGSRGTYAGIAASRPLGARTRLALQYSHAKQDAEGSQTASYSADIASVLVTMTF